MTYNMAGNMSPNQC